MAKIRCYECDAEVSSDAWRCPSCGAPWPGKGSSAREAKNRAGAEVGLAAGLGVIIPVLLLVAFFWIAC